MKYYNILEAPIKVTGLSIAAGDVFFRLPQEIISRVNAGVTGLAKNTTGGCVRFCTDSKQVEVKVTLRNTGNMNHMPLSGQSGVGVYFDGLFVSTARPANAAEKEYSMVLNRPVVLEDSVHKVECFLPLYNGITNMEIGIEDEAEISEAPEQKYKAVAFYGSSITQGGCASTPGNNYTAMLARWFDFPQRNLGFSGSGKGEEIVARYISMLDLSAFVLDYDHNAPSIEHLENTHKKFFSIIREAQPDLPVIFVSKPDFDPSPEANAKRRDVIFKTYSEAVAAGDKKVWFVDGESLFGPYETLNDRRACTVDGCHPNDLGFWRMADTIYPVLEEALASNVTESSEEAK